VDEARLAHLAVADDIDPGFRLLADALGNGFADASSDL
jgi:hypothetical protein